MWLAGALVRFSLLLIIKRKVRMRKKFLKVNSSPNNVTETETSHTFYETRKRTR